MQSESLLKWWPFTPQTMSAGMHGCHVLAIRADGKGYYGRVSEVTRDYVMLENGSQQQRLRFFDSPTTIAIVIPPRYEAPKMADRQLFGRNG